MSQALLLAGPLTWQRAKQALISVAQGVSFLHMSGIIHRDLKCANVLVSRNWDVKISGTMTSFNVFVYKFARFWAFSC